MPDNYFLLLHSQGDSWYLLQVVDEVDRVPGAEKVREGFALAVADLEGNKAVGF